MTFAHSWVFFLIPFYFVLEFYIYYKTRRNSLELPTAAFIRSRRTWRTSVIRWMRILPVLAVALLLSALSGPQRVDMVRQYLPSGINIMVALDVSGSMAAEDFQPLNRLEVAKTVLRDFIGGRPSDRIGLVLFAGRSVTNVPLTLQHGPLLKALEKVTLGTLPDGTAIGLAMISGLNRLTGGADEKSGGARILVLITDGINNAGEIHPLDALSIAMKQKIKIYTIGVGSFGEAPFPVFTREGVKTYRYGPADLDEDLLQQIADKTGGKYFRAADPRSMQLLFEQINLLEKSEPRAMESRALQSVSSDFAAPAFVILFFYILLTTAIVRLP